MTTSLALARVLRSLATAWRGLRRVSGDDAYEVYAAHARRHDRTPVCPRDFWLEALRRRYDRINRCC
jgi:uncharacterized short protein YbdD (DUF466 family)